MIAKGEDAGADEGGLENGVEVKGWGVDGDGDAGALAGEGHGGSKVAVAVIGEEEQEIAGRK